jgi:triosephosphate isomerase
MCDEPQGAFTGEVSAACCSTSERPSPSSGTRSAGTSTARTSALVNAKVGAALAAGLEVILCIGEKLDERQAGKTEDVCKTPARGRAPGRSTPGPTWAGVTIAYEPVWAIGTGHTATPAQAGEVHVYVRSLLEGLHGPRVAAATRIQYGGSVNPGNVRELLAGSRTSTERWWAAPSLKAETFLPILDFDR